MGNVMWCGIAPGNAVLWLEQEMRQGRAERRLEVSLESQSKDLELNLEDMRGTDVSL